MISPDFPSLSPRYSSSHFPLLFIPAIKLHCRFWRRGVRRMKSSTPIRSLVHLAMHWVKRPALNKIIGREKSGHGFAQHRDISGALRKKLVDAVVANVRAPCANAGGVASESFLQPLGRGPDPIRIHCENREWIVLPLDDAIERRPRRLRNVEKDHALPSISLNHSGRSFAQATPGPE